MSKITVGSNEYSDDGTASRDMQNGGHRTWLLPMMGDAMAVIDTASSFADTATTKAADAASSANNAANYAAAINGTSTSAVTLGGGSKTLTTQTGKQFQSGQAVLISRQSDSDLWMYGQVTSYSGSTLIIGVSSYNGEAAPYSDWNISLSGIQGPPQIAPAKISREERTSNIQLVAADTGKFIEIASGTFTQALAAAATLGNGWWCYYKNSGAGDITIDSAGSELIDGLSSFIMYPGETRFIQCDGVGFTSVVLSPFAKTFTVTGTFVKPPGYSFFKALLWSGGSSGGRSGSASIAAGGGAGGGCFEFTVPASELASSETVSIGAGGIYSTTNTGKIGGNTSIGSVATVYGGNLYTIGGSVIYGAVGEPYGFSATNNGIKTVYGGASSAFDGSDAGSSIYGGACGGYVRSGGLISAPGSSSFGGDGGAASISSNGSPGVAPGGGGGGTQTGTQSGPGARGECRIWGIA